MRVSNIKRLFSFLMVVCVLAGVLITPASAARVADATINMNKKASLTIFKYDFTNAAKDGVWSQDSYVSTGQFDANVNDILGGSNRVGDTDSKSELGNGDVSNGYAIKGVEFTYLKVADFYQFSESARNGGRTDSHIELLYKFDKDLAEVLLKAIGLENGKNSYENANALDDKCWYYQSDVLNKALADALKDNATNVKNALEAYVKANDGVAMNPTDEDGCTIETQLPLGLYLLVETKVPEGVTNTVNPFFVSLPMTNVNGGGNGQGANTTQVTDGGRTWLYDVVVYPKNETGIVTLTKELREAKGSTGKHNGTNAITDGFSHTATASAGDILEYQILSTLPTITSSATYISEYKFQDLLSRGLSYDKNAPVKIEWYTDADCTDLVCTWEQTDEKFDVKKDDNVDGTHTMTITMTDKGLDEINGINANATNHNGSLYAGYSNYTMRITYSVIVNSDESLVYGDDGNCNEVVLTWRRTANDYFDTLIDDAHVFSYGIDLAKVFSDGKKDQALFDKVLFKLQNKTDGYYVIAKLNETEGIWYVNGFTEDESAATAMNPVTWNEKPGHLVIKGLEDDEYIMTEIETADTYTLLKGDIGIEIVAKDDEDRACDVYSGDVIGLIQNDARYNFDGDLDLKLANIPQAALGHKFLTASAKVDGNAVTMLNDETDKDSANALVPFSVKNSHGFILPDTGDRGMQLLPIFGVLLVVSALSIIFIICYKNKKDKQEM